ncbi:hypothetical protein GUJ93_ZPchr0012g20565 [Zizania palustris]|uniref:Uncharacterized protein n=1 Tax=Zizania palustris TaxID=103762 RepID=A0A8J5WTE7_ZIZPA|nr:hypothetical protein GUJ93_ZPchr0012g20565 [Zizania palustris]
MGQRRREPWIGVLFLATGALLLWHALAVDEVHGSAAVATLNDTGERGDSVVLRNDDESVVSGDVDVVKRRGIDGANHDRVKIRGPSGGNDDSEDGGNGGGGGSNNRQSNNGEDDSDNREKSNDGDRENISGRGGRGAATNNNKGGGGNSDNEGGGGNSGGHRLDPIVCSNHNCKNYGNGKVNSQHVIITSGTQASGIPKPKGKP